MDPPDAIAVEPALGAVIARCLDKDRERRFHSVAELADALAPLGGERGRDHARAVRTLLVAPSGHAATVPASEPPRRRSGTTVETAGAIVPMLATTPRAARWPWLAGVAAAVVAVATFAVWPHGRDAQVTAATAEATIAQPPPAPQSPAPAAAVPASTTVAAATPPAHVAPAPASRPNTTVARAPRAVPAAHAARIAQADAPAPPPLVATQPSASVAAFHQAIAAHHCDRALAVLQALPDASADFNAEVTRCAQQRARAIADMSGPDAEAIILAHADDVELGGNAGGALGLRSTLYMVRTNKACKRHDVDAARAAFAKIPIAANRDAVVTACQGVGVTL
jgi:hypothetical protein